MVLSVAFFFLIEIWDSSLRRQMCDWSLAGKEMQSLAWLCFTKVWSPGPRPILSPPISLFFPQSRIWTKYLCKTGTGLYKYKTALLKGGDGWKQERGQKYLGFGPATSPWLSLLTFYRLGINQISLKTESELASWAESLEMNHWPQKFWLLWSILQFKLTMNHPNRTGKFTKSANSNPAARYLYLSMRVQLRFN